MATGSRTLLWILGVGAVAAVAAGAAFLLGGTSGPVAPALPPAEKSPEAAGPAPAPPPAPAAGASVTGRVLRGEKGEDALAGAAVEVFAGRGDSVCFLEPLAKGESGADGRFAIGGLEKGGAYRVRASLEGHASVQEDASAGGDAVELRLLPGTFVAGTVKDAETKEPVADAKIVAAPNNTVGTKSGADGAFRIERVSMGGVLLTASAPGYVESQQFVPVGPKGKDGVRFELVAASSVSGVVLGAGDAPVADAAVVAMVVSAEDESDESGNEGGAPASSSYSGKSGADGKFRVEGIPVGKSLLVRASSRDGIAAPVDAGPLRKGKPQEGLVLRLSPAAALVVTVLDEAGKPVEGAEVATLTAEQAARQDAEEAEAAASEDEDGPMAPVAVASAPPADPTPAPSGTTDASGIARVRPVPPGRTRVVATKEDFLPGRETVDAPASAETAVTIRLAAGVAVTGTVVDETGAPVAGAAVGVARFQGGGSVHQGRTTGADGSFRAAGLEGRGFHVTASKEGHVAASVADVDPAAGPLTLTLRRGGSIAGVVVDPDGKAVTAFRVTTKRTDDDAPPDPMAAMGFMDFGGNRFNDPAGKFRVDGLEPGTWEVTVRATDLAPGRVADVKVEAGKTADVKVAMPRGAVLGGIVVRGAAGTPVAGAKVSLSTAGPFGDMDMDVDLAEPEPGAEPAGEESEQARRVGEAMSMFGGGAAAVTGDDGRFTLKGLEAGTVDLRVKAKGLAPATQKGVPVPSESEVRIVLGEESAIEGTVYDARKAPKAGAMVMLQKLPMTMKMATTDAKGKYRIGGLAPGKYLFYVMEDPAAMAGGAGMNMRSESVELEEGKTLVKDYRIGEGVRVTGRVTRGGKPVSGAMVMLLPGAGRKDANAAAAVLGGSGFAMSTTTADGTYEITGLAAGVYTAMVQSGNGGGPAPGDPIEIVPGATEVRRDIALARNAVRGIVVDEDGKPVQGVQVTAVVSGKDMTHVADIGEAVAAVGGQTTTGQDGRFAMEDMNAGSFTLRAGASGRTPAFAENVIPTEAGVEVRLVITKGIEVTVRVVDGEGKPVAGAGIYLSDARGMDLSGMSGMELFEQKRTGADGRTKVSAPKGTVHFEAIVKGHAPGTAASEIDGPCEVTVTLPRGASFEVLVTDAGGAPRSGVSIRLLDAAGSPYATRLTMEGMTEFMTPPSTGQDGKYSRSDLPAGSYVVRATLGEKSADTTVTLVAGERKSATIRLP
jgi:protocatechuate 3,4-dioxygenase beta subunit